MNQLTDEQNTSLEHYFTLSILEQAILRRSRVAEVRSVLEEHFIGRLVQDDEVQALINEYVTMMTGFPVIQVGELLKDAHLESSSIFQGPRQAVLRKLSYLKQRLLSRYEHADFEECLKKSIAYLALVYRLCSFTDVIDYKLNYEDILTNLDSKRQRYLDQLTDSGIFIDTKALIDEHPHILDNCADAFISLLANNLSKPERFKIKAADLLVSYVKMFSSIDGSAEADEAHEYMYGHVKAPFDFLNQEKALNEGANLRRDIITSCD